MPALIFLELARNVCLKGVVWVGLSQERGNAEKDLGYSKCWAPIILENVNADGSSRVDVAMIDSRAKCHFRWLERIILWKRNVEIENAALVWAILRTHNLCYPLI